MPPTQRGADYRLRIFTPRGEVPFAGHPTLGSAHAVLEAGLATPHEDALVQECGTGLINLQCEREGPASRLALSVPSAVLMTLPQGEVQELEAILGLAVDRAVAPAIVKVGVAWVVAQLPSAQAALALDPDFHRLAEFERRLSITGISLYGVHPAGTPADIEVRSFLPSSGIAEDPVCGSGNGAIAAFRRARGQFSSEGTAYVASQGKCVGRDGRVFVHVTPQGNITIGGECVTTVNAHLTI